MVGAKLYLANQGRSLGMASLLLGSLLLAATIFIHLDLHRFIIFGIPSLLIVFGCLYVRQTSNKLLIYLGAASYSIYLVQVFSISAFYKFSSVFLTFLHPDLLAVLAVCFSALLGCATYEFIEKPLGRILGKSREAEGRAAALNVEPRLAQAEERGA